MYVSDRENLNPANLHVRDQGAAACTSTETAPFRTQSEASIYTRSLSVADEHSSLASDMRQYDLLFCILLGLSIAHAATMSWRNTYGCYAHGGNVAFNTSYCWDSGVVPSAGDTAIISLGTTSYGVEIDTNVSLSQLTVDGSHVTISSGETNISSITLINEAQLFYQTDSSSSSSIFISGGSSLVPLNSRLSVSQLTFSNASLYIAMHETFDLYCHSVAVQGSGLSISSSTKARTQLGWHFDSMSINGDIVDSASISHYYSPRSSFAVLTMSNTSVSPLTLWNTASYVTFDTVNVTVRSPVNLLASSITFSPNSTLTMNSTSFSLASINASSADVTLSSVTFNVADTEPYFENERVFIQANNIQNIRRVTVNQNTLIDKQCQGPPVIINSYGKVLILVIRRYEPPPISNFQIGKTNDKVYHGSFTRISDPCIRLLPSESYTFYNEQGSSQNVSFSGATPLVEFKITVPVPYGIDTYRLSYNYTNRDGRSYNANTYTDFLCNASNAGDKILSCPSHKLNRMQWSALNVDFSLDE
ncbi:hypothetical protein PROFUN_01014 [Planoprotostelium fungivorum]|uniref:Uncharacterized protein n=2 Tax=Planoprotostelium fungivorum TaxID=1890364 RepID=A0A2P6N4I0_9EUKA|nr:hypothetical protein PROFUN_01014 [Planoprotostelium fungivorum]